MILWRALNILNWHEKEQRGVAKHPMGVWKILIYGGKCNQNNARASIYKGWQKINVIPIVFILEEKDVGWQSCWLQVWR